MHAPCGIQRIISVAFKPAAVAQTNRNQENTSNGSGKAGAAGLLVVSSRSLSGNDSGVTGVASRRARLLEATAAGGDGGVVSGDISSWL